MNSTYDLRDLLIWEIKPIPDFVSDHTLTGESLADRLREVISRWVQWAGSLWSWRDEASFALRYAARRGSIRVFFMACAHDPSKRNQLFGEISVMLRSQRLGGAFLATAEVTADFEKECFPEGMALMEIAQHETSALWRLPSYLKGNDEFRRRFSWLPHEVSDAPPVVYPWAGPGGPYLVPMESLISQPVPVTLSVYLQPTTLAAHEWQWLAAMAQHAQSQAEQSLQQVGSGSGMRVVDPSSELAGKLYMANLRRLSAMPFLVTVQVAAADGRYDVAQTVAGAMQSLVHEVPYDSSSEGDERLPSGCASRAFDELAALEAAAGQYFGLRFPVGAVVESLQRFRYLADAKGAATMFRLPVSIRGGVPGIEVRQLPPDFHPGPRAAAKLERHLKLGVYQAGGDAYFPVDDLCKHALITGFTGSGKTVTVLQLLYQLWVDHRIPFLVLESAKQEYRGLLGVGGLSDDLSVYTLGNDLCVPFRLNPFELLPGVRVEAHLSKLQTCFEGAIPPIGPSSSVISEALLRVYAACGWSMTDVYPRNGNSRRSFPQLSGFVLMIEKVLQERGYEGEVRSNLNAALVGRFKPLLIGGKGRMFDTQRTEPSATAMFTRPAVLEMNDLSVDDKALVVMFLLMLLREHREQNKSRNGQLVHVTMVEEAHNILENVSSKGGGEGAASADTRFKAVEAFCQLLTEIRSLGEGLIIADQSPEKLAADALRNTNLQIAHQLRDGNDRKAIANAMIMEKEQCDFLGKLRPGQAALFRTGLEKATFIQVDLFSPTARERETAEQNPGGAAWSALRVKYGDRLGFNSLLTDDEVQAIMANRNAGTLSTSRLDLPCRGCEFCRRQCVYRDAIFPEMKEPASLDAAESFLTVYCDEEKFTAADVWKSASAASREALIRCGIGETDSDAAWCVFVHLWDFLFDVRDASKSLSGENHAAFLNVYNRSVDA